MHAKSFFSTIIGLLLCGTQSVNALFCFQSGESWYDLEEARSFVSDACRREGGAFTGWFEARQRKSLFGESADGSKLNYFEITNLNGLEGFDLGDDDCYTRLIEIIYNCPNGGESERAGWQSRAAAKKREG